jgi:hypothetical protein
MGGGEAAAVEILRTGLVGRGVEGESWVDYVVVVMVGESTLDGAVKK